VQPTKARSNEFGEHAQVAAAEVVVHQIFRTNQGLKMILKLA
jgi:hypothetical protein